MSQKDIKIQHKWHLEYNRDMCHYCYQPSTKVYLNSFISSLIPGIKFEILFYDSNDGKCVLFLSKSPRTRANATIAFQIGTNKIEQIDAERWTDGCLLKCNYEPRKQRDYCASGYLRIEFKCDITWRSLKKPKPPKVSILSGRLKDFFTSPNLSDMTIVIDEKEIPVHRIILAVYSPVFLAMFNADMVESANKRIIVTDIEVDIMKKVIEFMYTGVMNPIPKFDVLLLILGVANKYEIMILKDLCEEELRKNITIENVLTIFEEASLYEVPQLMESIISFMIKHKLEIIVQENFKDLYRRKPEILFEFFISTISGL